MIAVVTPFLAAFALSLALVPLCRLLAMRMGRMAHPREDRWHRRPVALLGGVAIGLALFAGAGVFGLVDQVPVLLVCALVAFLTGLTDDLINLKPSTKLVVQIALGSTLLFFDYRLNWVHSVTLDSLLTLFWVVGMTNAFNLLDNMDGLCAGVALIVGTALLVDLLPGSTGAAFADVRYLSLLLGATAGFFVYNVHPASIFMGDSGSLLLGFSFAAMTLSSTHEGAGRSDVLSIVAAPVLLLMIPIFDTTFVTVSRMLSGRSAAQGGRDHSSHRLVAIGLSERGAVAVLWLLAAIGGAIGVAVDYVSRSWAGLAALIFLVGMALFAAYLAGTRVYDENDEHIKARVFTPIVVDFMYKRRVAEVLLDFCLTTIAYYAAYKLRFEDPEDFMKNFANFTRSFPVVIGAQMIAFFAVGTYRGMWRHFGMRDTVVVAKGVFLGVVSAQLAILYIYRFFSYSRTVFVIYAVLLLLAVTLSRASFRLVGDYIRRQKRSGRRILVNGAGEGGTLVMRELQNRDDAVRLIGFIDDDPHKTGTRVHGIPVLGNFAALVGVVNRSGVDQVVIGARELDPNRLIELRALCAGSHVALSRLHLGLEDLVVVTADASHARPYIRRVESYTSLGVLVDFFKFHLQPASPLAIVIVFGIGAVWAYARPASRAPRRYLAAAVCGFWLMATPIGAGALSWGLAHGLTQVTTREEARGATAVVVLGGGAQTFSAGGQVVGSLTSSSILRTLEGARVAKLIGASVVIASGGKPDPEIQLKPESEMIRAVLIQAGVPSGTIIEDSTSKTTREQGRLIAPMLRAQGVRQFVLVTSPVHMRRSLDVFRLEGFTPVPSVALTRAEHLRRPPLLLPNGGSLDVSQEAIYDYAAMVYYWGRGWR